MTLHILNHGPCHPSFKQCVATFQENDAIILIGDGTYCAEILKISHHESAYALVDDCRARGITPSIATINYSEFVELTCKHNPIQTWY